MNTNLLKAQMVANGDRQDDLAQALSLSRSALNSKVNGKKPFRQDEMNLIMDRYGLSAEQMVSIFFDD